MTSDSPSSPSDGPMQPPPHRPPLDHLLARDSTELDLWAFDEELEKPEPAEKPVRTTKSEFRIGDLPSPRERLGIKQTKVSENPQETGPQPVAGGVRSKHSKIHSILTPGSHPQRDILQEASDLDDLENWEDDPGFPRATKEGRSPESEDAASGRPELGTAQRTAVEEQADLSGQELQPVESDTVGAAQSELAPAEQDHPTHAPVRPRLGLSHLERIGLILLLVLVVGGGVGTLVVSIMPLPRESARARAADFPINGSLVTVRSADSYWREPITDGSSPEIVRRDTKLLPVIELDVSEGSGAIRVLFRNDERRVMGDAVTRTVDGPGTVVIPATAGFEDLGMHAAYRTGGSKPWTIEVYEAPPGTSSSRDFKKLFEINISTDRR